MDSGGEQNVTTTKELRTARRLGAWAKRALVDTYGTVRWRLARRVGRRATIEPGITVVTVNWNTLPFLRVLVETVRARSPEGTRILVIDNASRDGSHEYLRSRPEIESVLLRVNIRHGRALDLGVTMARTDTVIVLDIDAFPTTNTWLDDSLAALEQGRVLSGAYFHRNFVHPCFMVFRRESIVANELSFKPVGLHPQGGGRPFGPFMDVGEAISQAVLVRFGDEGLHRIPFTEVRGPDMVGTVFGDVVYHNFHTTYSAHRSTALARFHEAVERFGAAGWVEPGDEVQQ